MIIDADQHAASLPARLEDLTIRALGDGRYVVKNSGTGEYLHLGEEEHFLLVQLDGRQDEAAVCAAYAVHFGQSLDADELREFVQSAQEQGLLQSSEHSNEGTNTQADARSRVEPIFADSLSTQTTSDRRRVPQPDGNSILNWRKRVFDPDRLFTWLAPKIWFIWTSIFLVISTGTILLAIVLVWTNWHEVASSFQSALRWESIVLGAAALVVISLVHEFAHGLTCKHFGGEVREIGFLMMFLMPCLYCDVSDAWMFREKSKRLWVTFAGAYCELILWALAVIVWRLTLPDTPINHLAFIVLSLCGVETLLNFNPLIKLDGYYMLSDWLEIPNLRQRALDTWLAHVRWLLWGAPFPQTEPRGQVLLWFGMASWFFSMALLIFVLAGLVWWMLPGLGLIGLAAIVVVGLIGARAVLEGFSIGEVSKMLKSRVLRTFVWTLILAGVGAALQLVEVEDRVKGPFEVRSRARAELRAPAAGFLREINVEEGDHAYPGMIIARLEVTDLPSRLAQKRLEVVEAEARLRLLESGTRSEELDHQLSRVERATEWRDLAADDLVHNQHALEAELELLDQQIVQYRAELDAANSAFKRLKPLASSRAVSDEQMREAERRVQVGQARWNKSKAEKRRRQALGTRQAIADLDAHSELAHREAELAEARDALTLLEAGNRPEEIEAQRALLARLREEAGFLEQLQLSLVIRAPIEGVIATPRLKEKLGHFVEQGALLCTVEDPSVLRVEIVLREQDAGAAQLGQKVALRSRALSSRTLDSEVTRIAPAAISHESQNSVTVYCELENSDHQLRPGTTGFARIQTGQRPIFHIARDRVLRFVRTEFWHWSW